MKLSAPNSLIDIPVKLPASKSISNRLLIIQALATRGEILNLSDAKDTVVLQELLQKMPNTLNVGHAGTAFRFLTAFLSITSGNHILTGSERMKNRPIAPLVDALKSLGAEIQYIEKEGYPPLKIKGKKLDGGKVNIDSSTSSQFISALMLIAPKLKNGLNIQLDGDVVSKPYLQMTASLMSRCGVELGLKKNEIRIEKSTYHFERIEVEHDWSAAAFWFQLVAISKMPHLLLKGVKSESIQGDSRVVELFRGFGVESYFDSLGLHLNYFERPINYPESINFKEIPDLVQPFLVTAAAVNYPVQLTGVQTLKIKETDRLQALKNELSKFGCVLEISKNTVSLVKGIGKKLPADGTIKTYQDHRMAMAFAPLSILGDLEIESPDVVGKSYPQYWEELQKLGFTTVS